MPFHHPQEQRITIVRPVNHGEQYCVNSVNCLWPYGELMQVLVSYQLDPWNSLLKSMGVTASALHLFVYYTDALLQLTSIIINFLFSHDNCISLHLGDCWHHHHMFTETLCTVKGPETPNWHQGPICDKGWLLHCLTSPESWSKNFILNEPWRSQPAYTAVSKNI